MTDTTTTQPTSEDPQKTGHWQADRLARLRLAHEAIMVQDAQGILNQDRHLTDQHQRALGSVQDPTPEDDDMIVGDITNITNQAPPPAPSGMGTLAKGLAAAGLAAAGIGTGLALPIAAWNLFRPDTTIVNDPTEDTDTQYDWKILKD